MDFTVLVATAFSAELFLPHFQPVTTIVALHIAVLLPQVYVSLWISLKGELGPRKIQKVLFVELT